MARIHAALFSVLLLITSSPLWALDLGVKPRAGVGRLVQELSLNISDATQQTGTSDYNVELMYVSLGATFTLNDRLFFTCRASQHTGAKRLTHLDKQQTLNITVAWGFYCITSSQCGIAASRRPLLSKEIL